MAVFEKSKHRLFVADQFGITKEPEPEKFKFTDFQKEVLGKYDYLKYNCLPGGEFHWCYFPWESNLQYLMLHSERNDTCWIVGFVWDYDLAKNLPKIMFSQFTKMY